MTNKITKANAEKMHLNLFEERGLNKKKTDRMTTLLFFHFNVSNEKKKTERRNENAMI